LSGSKTVDLASFNAFKKNIADMADLLKQMWFLMTIEMYKQADKRQSVISIKTLMSELGRT
jgi:hypothetical protein